MLGSFGGPGLDPGSNGEHLDGKCLFLVVKSIMSRHFY